jgi:DNA replication and repair protein RecF
MYLQKLILNNFKNCEEATLHFSDKINCFIGDNGAGKTNILDGIFYLSFCKSYFNNIDTQNILHDRDYFAIHGTYSRNGDQADKVSCLQKVNHKKSFRINSKEYERLADHIGLFPLVMISPYDRDLINEGSDQRRKYIDGVISQFDRIYLDNLISYNKALSQRNALLKSFADSSSFNRASLEIWDRQLSDYGTLIFQRREEFIESLIPIFQQYFEEISGGRETVSINYDSQLHERGLEELLSVSVEKDRRLKYTTTGIHKDDLAFTIGGYPLKKFGSQGQQKSFVIALKLAQFEFTKKLKGFKPILLFDDIFDKLDDHRVSHIISLVGHDNFGQVFITDTQEKRIEKLFAESTIDHMIFKVESGAVTEIKNNHNDKKVK